MNDKMEQYGRITKAILSKGEKDNSDIRQIFDAEKMLSIYNAYVFKKAYDIKNKVAFVFERFPREIVFGFKMVPMDLESLAALFARGKIVEECLREADANQITRDICSVLRSMLGVAYSHYYPTPDLVFCSNHPCNGYFKTVQHIRKLYRIEKAYELMIPSKMNERNIIFVKNQFMKLIKEIQNETENKFIEDDFNASINASNTARIYYRKTAALLKDHYIKGLSNALMQISSISPWGSIEIAKICEKLYHEASAAEKMPLTKKRVIWIGQIPYYGNQLIKYIEEKYEILYCASLSNLHYVIDNNDPFASLAEITISALWHYKRIVGNICNVAAEYHSNLVILQNSWGCRNLLGVNSIIRNCLKKNDIKVLTIDNDFMDITKISFGHIKNRIDAFTEING